MQVIEARDELREQLDEWRRAGEEIALVPTMGNLHEGHLGLVSLARKHAERVVVSVFVNPTQFSEGKDFDNYPRTLERDKRHLKRVKTDMLFVPSIETIYPFGTDSATSVTVPVLSEEFISLARPGQFDGVTSVLSRLFSLIRPDVAIFGEKGYQRQLVIRRMIADMHLPIKLVSGPTARGDDGLALSFRNQQLSEEQRAVAPELYASLRELADALQAGNDDYEALEAHAVKRLDDKGFETEFVSVRRAENLAMPDRGTDRLVILAATKLGDLRMIDNIVVEI